MKQLVQSLCMAAGHSTFLNTARAALLSHLDKLRVAAVRNNVSRSMPEQCSHNWVVQYHGDCPYGWPGPGDVTWPDYQRATSLHAPMEEGQTGNEFLLGMCVFFSYIPYIAACVIAVELLRRRGTRELNLLLFTALVCGVNEFCVKPFVEEPRPELSCIKTCGMPSSHAALAMGFLVLCLADFVWRINPQEDEMQAMAQSSGLESQSQSRKLCGWIRRWCLPTDIYLDEFGVSQGLFYSLLCMCAYLPVPTCRVQLSDHTWEQMWAGIWVGILIGMAWLFALRALQHRYNHFLGQRLPVIRLLHHNLPLPCSVAMRRCKRDGRASFPSRAPCKSQAPVLELKWYLKETDARLSWLHKVGFGNAGSEVGYLEARRAQLQHMIQSLNSPPSSELYHSTAVLHAGLEHAPADDGGRVQVPQDAHRDAVQGVLSTRVV